MMAKTRKNQYGLKWRVSSVICAILLFLGMAATLSASEIDLSKAVRIGSGSKTVIEFTDPDCPFCRQASRYLDGRSDVTRYVFFAPLDSHPKAKEKVRFILSQKDKARAYHDVMAGDKDNAKTLRATEQGAKLQREHSEIASRLGVKSMPTFMVFGRIIVGFDEQEFREILGE